MNLTSLVKMLNKIIENIDKIISIKQVLKINKMNLIWINLYVWFFQICQELKCLLI